MSSWFKLGTFGPRQAPGHLEVSRLDFGVLLLFDELMVVVGLFAEQALGSWTQFVELAGVL